MFDHLVKNYAIDSATSDGLFVDLYKRGICHFNQLGIITGQRGLHVVPPLWFDSNDNQPLTPDSNTCHYLRSEDHLNTKPKPYTKKKPIVAQYPMHIFCIDLYSYDEEVRRWLSPESISCLRCF